MVRFGGLQIVGEEKKKF